MQANRSGPWSPVCLVVIPRRRMPASAPHPSPTVAEVKRSKPEGCCKIGETIRRGVSALLRIACRWAHPTRNEPFSPVFEMDRHAVPIKELLRKRWDRSEVILFYLHLFLPKHSLSARTPSQPLEAGFGADPPTSPEVRTTCRPFGDFFLLSSRSGQTVGMSCVGDEQRENQAWIAIPAFP